MAKVFIPQVGDKIELSSNWNCKIFNERRNSSVFEALGVDVSNMPNSNIDITFPKGTVFKVTRLYVRAPASSYDSLTLSVVSSPIKKLAKAKFWVKIMDANNMEFDSKELTFNDFDSLSSLFRHIALKDGQTNENKISTKDSQVYLEQIKDFFYKPEQVISFTVALDKNEIARTFQLKNTYSTWTNNDLYEQEVKELKEALPESLNVTVTVHPALGGFIFKIHQSMEILSIDMKLGYFNQIDESYRWRPRLLGSFLSRDYLYSVDNLKKSTITYLEKALDEKVDFIVGGETQKIKNKTAFNKLVSGFYK